MNKGRTSGSSRFLRLEGEWVTPPPGIKRPQLRYPWQIWLSVVSDALVWFGLGWCAALWFAR